MAKVLILGWENGLIPDGAESRLQPSYLAMLQKVEPSLASAWTLENTRNMQGIPPHKIWEDAVLLWGEKKGEMAKNVFNETYARFPVPSLVDNAVPFMKKMSGLGYRIIVVSAQDEEILWNEARELGVDRLVSGFVGTSRNFMNGISSDDPQLAEKARCELLLLAMLVGRGAGQLDETVVVAGAGYQKVVYDLRTNRYAFDRGLKVDRYEEASPEVFDWLIDEFN